MAITFKYEGGAGLIGAFGAGQASARRRRHKYAMDALLQQQRHQQRMQEIGARFGPGVGALRGRRRGGLAGQEIVGWNDPLAQIQDPVHRRAAGRARARKARLGRLPAEAMPTPIRQVDLDRAEQDRERQADWEDWLRRQQAQWGHEGTVRDLERERELEDEARALDQARDAELDDDLQEGRLVLSPGAQQRIDGIRDDLERKLPEMDDAQQQEAIEKANERIRQIKRWGARLPEGDQRPTDERLKEFLGEDNFEKFGHLPWVPDGQGGFEVADIPEDKAATAAAAEEEARQKKRAEFKQKRFEQYLEKRNDPTYKGADKPKSREEAELFAEQDALALEGPSTIPGVPNQQPVRRESPAGSVVPPSPPPVAPQEPPTPTGEQPRRPIAPPGTATGMGGWTVDPNAPPTPTGEQIAPPGTATGMGGWTVDPNAPPLAPGERLRLLTELEQSRAPGDVDLDQLQPEHFYDGKLHDKPKPFPKGVPDGSRWVGENGIMLPNGKIIRPKSPKSPKRR